MNKYIIYPGNNSQLIKQALEARENWLETSELHANFVWRPQLLPLRVLNLWDDLMLSGEGFFVHNHLENHKKITTKSGLIRSLRQYYYSFEGAVYSGYTIHHTIPTSFILTAQSEDLEYSRFINRFNELANSNFSKEKVPEKHCTSNLWLLKPDNLNQGRGIKISSNLAEIQQFLKSQKAQSLWVLQKYIERPLLYFNRKFDIRIWALATSKHDFFYYKKGYLRTSSSKYNSQAKDQYVHLTNNCLQKFGENYGAFEEGNTLSFEDFQDYIDTNTQLKVNVWTDLVPQMVDIMIDTYLSAKKQLHKHRKSLCFELLGFDFLVDENTKVWLLEVNTNPYLGTPNQYISELLRDMIDDMLDLVVDVHFPPKNPRTRTQNNFELLYCEINSNYSSSSVNLRRNFGNSSFKRRTEKSKTTVARKETKEISAPCTPLENKQCSEQEITRHIEAFYMLTENNEQDFQACRMIIRTLSYKNLDENLKISILQMITKSFKSVQLKKELTQAGCSHVLINLLFSSNVSNELQTLCLQALQALSTHPCRKNWIPGESREQGLIRTKILSEGVFSALLLLKSIYEGKRKQELQMFIENEFELQEWEAQLLMIDRLINNANGSISPRLLPNFPKCLLEGHLLIRIQLELYQLINFRRRKLIEKRIVEEKERPKTCIAKVNENSGRRQTIKKKFGLKLPPSKVLVLGTVPSKKLVNHRQSKRTIRAEDSLVGEYGIPLLSQNLSK